MSIHSFSRIDVDRLIRMLEQNSPQPLRRGWKERFISFAENPFHQDPDKLAGFLKRETMPGPKGFRADLTIWGEVCYGR